MSLSSRAPVEPQDAIGYIASVEQIFKQQPEFYDQFLEAMVEYNSGRAGVETTVDRVVDILHPFPDLLRGFNAFLPEQYEVCSSRHAEDPRYSVVRVSRPTGNEERIRRIHVDLWDLLEAKGPRGRELMEMLKFLEDVGMHYRETPSVSDEVVKAIQPRPDDSRDKYQVAKELEIILHDSPELIERFKKLMEI